VVSIKVTKDQGVVVGKSQEAGKVRVMAGRTRRYRRVVHIINVEFRFSNFNTNCQ
jgi:hypothetical protein